jgi:hypothetical protein
MDNDEKHNICTDVQMLLLPVFTDTEEMLAGLSVKRSSNMCQLNRN